MSTFDYRCSVCEDEQLDVTQSIHDDPLTHCNTCGFETLERIIRPAGGFRIGGEGVSRPTAYTKIDTKLGQK